MTLEQELIHYKNLVKLYKFDYLTGLKQRRDFEYETNHKMQNQEFYLAMFDVNDLHNINREKGYSHGDALIKSVANQIQQSENLWELYRVGGDEFFALYFMEPNVDIINCATGAYVHSSDFKDFNKMLESVDKLLTQKKTNKRRRSTDI